MHTQRLPCMRQVFMLMLVHVVFAFTRPGHPNLSKLRVDQQVTARGEVMWSRDFRGIKK